jgi:hypothetical protein
VSLLLLFRPMSGIGGPPEPEPEPVVVARGADGSRRKGKLPKFWWESEKRRELELPYKPPPFSTPVQKMHIAYKDPVLEVDARLEVERAYKRKKRLKDIKAIMKVILDDE